MRIVIDLQGAQTASRFRGIGRYSLSLAQAIVRNRGNHEVLIVLSGLFPETIKPIRNSFVGQLEQENILIWHAPAPVRSMDTRNKWRCHAAELVREAFFTSLTPDVVLVSSLFEGFVDDAVTSIGLLSSSVPTAVILYDLIPLVYRDSYLNDPVAKTWYETKLNHIQRSKLLLAISEFSRQEGIRYLKWPPNKIANISTAVDRCFCPITINNNEVNDLKERLGLNRSFVLYTGGADERKNLPRLIRAYAKLSTKLRSSHQLVFAGEMEESNINQLQAEANRAGLLTRELIFIGYISDEDLVKLYNLCALFVFPSWHEGFGLPVLEAMACGAVVIGANTSSLQEVIGNADALFDPSSEESITNKITNGLTNEIFRQKLRRQSVDRAKRFSWDECAERAIYVLERVHGTGLIRKSNTWKQQLDKREYRELIDSIASISIPNTRPIDADLVNCAVSIADNLKLADHIARAQVLPKQITWRIEGPFDSNYSLALLNRETARALKALGHNVILYSTEGPGDFLPSEKFLRENPDIEDMYVRNHEVSSDKADVTSRNLYPPRVADLDCRFSLLHHYAWEESGFPLKWVEDFNNNLQGITCLSRHVEKIMIDHGVTVPLSVSGCGADHWERIEPDSSFVSKGRAFRFLHVSSCFPRKGVDLLLKAYGRAFSDADDVTLIIKTFPNPHNNIHRLLAEAQKNKTNYPDVVIIEEYLSDPQLKTLYQQCQALVAPSFAEGFGLPLAEAMLSGLTVITTAWGGQMDFCNEETAWLIDYTFEPACTHFNLFDSVWAVPDLDQLTQTMHEVYKLPESIRKRRSVKGREFLLDRFKWSDVAGRLVESARSWARMSIHPRLRIGWITTWNIRCGISNYSAHLVKNMPGDVSIFAAHTDAPTGNDGSEVTRCWFSGDNDSLDELANKIEQQSINTIVLQFNYGFFNLQYLSRFINIQLNNGRKIVITLHSTIDPLDNPDKKFNSLVDPLKRCHKILVHSSKDLNRLKARGLIDNVTLFPHGIVDYDARPNYSSSSYFTIASYGFFLPKKGLLELIDALALLREDGIDFRLRMVNAEYPIPDSKILIDKAKRKISKYKLDSYVEIITEFLTDEECLSLLADSGMVVFPYQSTHESSSAAVRHGIASGRPVAVTPLPIFDDVTPAVFYLPGQSPKNIANGIKKIFNEIKSNSPFIQNKFLEAGRWRDTHRCTILGLRLYRMLKALNNNCSKRQ